MTVGASADDALMAAARRGDDAAFDMLVRRHSTKMYRVAYRILADSAEAEDAVQEAWVSAWRSLGRFRGDSAPTTWLYRVVTNAALATLRRRKPTVPLSPNDELIPDRATADPEDQVVRSEEAARVHRAIATLEPSQRVPLVLRELEGLSYEEIAEMLDVPVTALRARLHRARVTLLARLKEM